MERWMLRRGKAGGWVTEQLAAAGICVAEWIRMGSLPGLTEHQGRRRTRIPKPWGKGQAPHPPTSRSVGNTPKDGVNLRKEGRTCPPAGALRGSAVRDAGPGLGQIGEFCGFNNPTEKGPSQKRKGKDRICVPLCRVCSPSARIWRKRCVCPSVQLTVDYVGSPFVPLFSPPLPTLLLLLFLSWFPP